MTDGRLRIGVDARELRGSSTGVGRYLGELLRRWLARPDAPVRQFLLYAADAVSLPAPPGALVPRPVGSGTGTLWEQTTLRAAIAADRPGVFFAPAYTAPLALPCPLVATIHDVSFAAHPEWFRRIEGLRRRFVTRHTARRAATVLTDSEFSKSEIVAHLGVPADRVRVVYPGTGLAPRPSTTAPREPLVLYVGSLFNRRRLPDLIGAFALATGDLPDARLVIVGANRTWPPQDLRAAAAGLGVADRVRIADFVPDDELADLYGRASVFAFLSEYEGFGLTPLEALAAGVPPLVLDTPIAREIYGDAAALVGPQLERQAAMLRQLLLDDRARAAVLAGAPAVLARYSWDEAARQTLDLLERAARP